MTSVFRAGIAVLAVFAFVPPAGASPVMSGASTRSYTCDGFLHSLFHPKVDLGHGVRALAYPVKKAAVNGGKAAVGAAASYYIDSKKPGIPSILPKK